MCSVFECLLMPGIVHHRRHWIHVLPIGRGDNMKLVLVKVSRTGDGFVQVWHPLLLAKHRAGTCPTVDSHLSVEYQKTKLLLTSPLVCGHRGFTSALVATPCGSSGANNMSLTFGFK